MPRNSQISLSPRTRFLPWALALLLSGCVASNVEFLPVYDPASTELPEDQGLLVIQVADTTPTGQSYPANQLTVAAKDVTETDAKLQRTVAVENFGKSTQLFTALLPANEYSIQSLRSFYQFGDAYFSRFYPAGIEFGTFRIEPGKVTDLGLLGVFIDRNGEDYTYATSRLRLDANKNQIKNKAKLPAQTHSDSEQHSITWNPDGNATERQNMYRRATNRQIVYGALHLDHDSGAISYPTRLGMIVQRDADGNWGLDAFNEDVEIQSLTRINNDTVIITEFDQIYRRQDGETTWVEVANPAANAEVTSKPVYIGTHPQGGLIAVTYHSGGATLWTAQGYDQTWEQRQQLQMKLRLFESAKSTNLLNIDKKIHGSRTVSNGRYLFLVLRDELYRYEYATDTMTLLKVDQVESLQIRNGTITLTSNAMFSSDKVSFDTGESWSNYRGGYTGDIHPDDAPRTPVGNRTRKPAPKLIGHPIFASRDAGYAIHQASKPSKQAFLIKSRDQGKTWQNAGGELPKHCLDLELATENELLLRCFLSGEFYRSNDAGATWELDREVSET